MSGRGCTCHLLSHQSCDFKFKSLFSDCALLIYKGNISCQDVCSYSAKRQVEPRPSCVMWIDVRACVNSFSLFFFWVYYQTRHCFHSSVNRAPLWGQRFHLHFLPRYKEKYHFILWNLSLMLSIIWETSSISYFFCSPNPSAHPNRSMRTASRTVRTTAGGPSSVVQVQRCQALQRPPPMSPHGPLPRSCHPTVAVA